MIDNNEVDVYLNEPIINEKKRRFWYTQSSKD